jgi:hypothetical protein
VLPYPPPDCLVSELADQPDASTPCATGSRSSSATRGSRARCASASGMRAGARASRPCRTRTPSRPPTAAQQEATPDSASGARRAPRAVELFAPLDDTARERLAQRMRGSSSRPASRSCTRAPSGDSLYVVQARRGRRTRPGGRLGRPTWRRSARVISSARCRP